MANGTWADLIRNMVILRVSATGIVRVGAQTGLGIGSL